MATWSFKYGITRGILLVALCLFAGGHDLEAQPPKGSAPGMVNIEGVNYYVHPVKHGETIYSLSRLYEVGEMDIIRNNPQAADGLREGQVLKIPARQDQKQMSDRKAARTFEVHSVQKGETAYSISKHYGIPVATLTEDNPEMDPTRLSIGQTLNIRRNDIGSQAPGQIESQWDQYTRRMNSVSDNVVYHLVQPGETLYGLSRQYGVGQSDITKLNGMTSADIKSGVILKIPVGAAPAAAAAPVAAPSSAPAAANGQQRQDVVAPQLFPFFRRQDNQQPRRYDPSRPMNISLLLPLQNQGGMGHSFLEFYQGALLAVEDLRKQGVSMDLTLFDTERSEERTAAIVRSEAFGRSDLIIGPVYEDAMPPVLEFAANNSVAVVSPLANMERSESSLLYQLAPDPSLKYSKLKPFLSQENNVTVISSGSNDAEFEREIHAALPASATRFAYSRSVSASDLEKLLRGDRNNVLVVLSQDEHTIDEMLARISSVQNNLVARGQATGSVTVVGSSRWLRFPNIDRNLFFKMNVCMVTNYYADRSNPTVMNFSKRYVSAFGALPTSYSYRGYDALKLFAGAMAAQGDRGYFENVLNNSDQQLLQMPYRFEQAEPGGTHLNTQWALVCYHNNFTIEVR